MINILGKTGLTTIQKIGESLTAEVFLSKNENPKESVFIKKIRPEFALDGIKERIEQQIAHLMQLNIKQVIVPELQTDSDGALLLISPFCEGQVLSKWLADRKKIDIKTLLEIGVALADCLAVRHKAALIHKSVKPGNILLQENPVSVHLIDDIRVSDISCLSSFIQNNQYKCGTLPYLAPEQTGRIRFNESCHSDLYALGAVLYECAASRPPFVSDNPLSIIHSHLAEIPSPVSNLNLDCPKIISDIIAVLLEKSPERRYLSATGLCADLRICLNLWEKAQQETLSERIPAFILKQKDFSSRITLPSIMVGREKQKNRLLDEYQRVCTGKLGIAVISGLSGMGKTRLVQELEIPIVEQKGYYTSGKFNQYTSHLPYSTLTEALGRLIRLFLTEDAGKIVYWQKQILNEIGENGQLLVDLIPDMERLIGKQPKIIPLPPAEAKNRFNDLFCRFLACLASAEHPLVLFIDDMQWCDHATFDLLDIIISQPGDFPYLFIIGAYRSNEVDEDHRIVQLNTTIEKSSLSLLKLHVDLLGKDSVNQMIASILNAYVSSIQKLTDIIYPVSNGNPLIVNETMRWLHQNKRLFLSEKGRWIWDIDALIDLQLPDSPKALFYDKLKQFSEDVKEILSVAAMIGANFKANDLVLVMQIPLQKLYMLLKDVFAQRILLRDGTRLYFFHDQIQIAAASFLDDEQKQQIHMRIARVFIDQQKQKTVLSSARLFFIVEHLNAGGMGCANKAELFEAAQFNYRAGETAMDLLAIEACCHYFSQSLKLCYNGLWQTDYHFMFNLYKKFARAVLISGDQKRSNEIVAIAIKHAKTDLDRAECLYEQTVAYASLGNVDRSIDFASQALNLIGIYLPVSEDDINAELLHLADDLYQNSRSICSNIVDAPLLKGQQNILEFHLYGAVVSSCYASGKYSMFMLMAMRAINLGLNKGIDDFICYALSITAVYFKIQEKYQVADLYEDTMLKMVERFPDTFGSVRGITNLLWFLPHSKYSIYYLQEFCQNTMDSGRKCGELNYAGIANCSLVWYIFVQGKNMPQLKTRIKSLISFTQKFNLSLPLSGGEAMQMSLSPLWESDPTSFDESYILSKLNFWKEQNYTVVLGVYFVFKGIVAYYNGQYKQAKQFLDKGETCLIGILGTIVYCLWYVFKYLVNLETKNRSDTEDYIEKVTSWASHGSILKPYLSLMQVEAIAFKGCFKEVRNAYLDAIDLAHRQEYLFLEAFLNERLGQYLKKENHFSYRTYLNSAAILYQDCGAINKAAQLNKTCENLLSVTAQTKQDELFKQQQDVNFLIDATRLIMQEKDYNLLLQQILSCAMERLGAKTGYLLLYKNKELLLCAKGRKDTLVETEIYEQKKTSTDNFCIEIARYVVRIQKPLVLDNACKEGGFTHCPDVLKYQLKSILCVPLINKTLSLGVLYLENSLISSVFTESQVKLIFMLTAQAAIALEHNLLITQLSENEQRLSTTLDSIGEGVIVIDVTGNIKRINPVAETLTGWSKKEALGCSVERVYNIFDASTKKPILNSVKKVLESRKAVYLNNNTILTAKDGEKRHITDSVAPIFNDKDVIEGVVLVFNDVTENYRLRSQLAQSRKMDALGKLTSGIAHDYNNMLGVILGNTELLEMVKGDQPEIAKYTKQIRYAGERGAKLTQKLLSFSRQEQSQACESDINKLISEMQMMLEKTLTVRISLNLDLCSNLWPVWIDAGELEDAVLNMSINAMHAIEHTGNLRLKTSMGYLDRRDAKKIQLPAGDYVMLSVFDSGSGMDKHTAEQIFDPFFTTKGEKGTGLGLSQVYGFVKRSKGAIDVYSSLVQGTRFVLYFPRYMPNDETVCQEDVIDSNQNWYGSQTILVVDDEPVLADLICEMLRQYGYNVFCAAGGYQALEILKKETVDLMVCDVIMPGMNGYQLAAKIQQIYPLIKIQMVSGYVGNLDSAFTDSLLYSQMIIKPFSLKTLLARIKKLLNK